MPKYIIKIEDKKHGCDWYLDWSTIVDAPVTWGMTLGEYKEWYKEQNGLNGMEELPERLERVEKYGTSSMFQKTVKEIISCNRAGKNERHASIEYILENYCRNHIA